MKILRKTMPFLASVLLFVSCNKEAEQVKQIDGPSSDSGKKEVVFGFSTAAMGNPQTANPAKTAATRADEPPIEMDLKNVRVLQFDGDTGDAKLVFNEYYSGDQVVTENEGGTTKKKLYVSIFEQEKSCIYVIANAGENQLKSLSLGTKLSDFEAMTLKFASENDVTADSALPMVGKSTESTDANSSISISLTRMVAKVVFTCNVAIPTSINESFKITRIQVLNAASGVCFTAPAVPTGTSGLYPDGSSSDNFFDYAEVPVTTAASVSHTWYLPENLRGVVAGLTEKTKGGDKVPAHSTCIEVSGDYTKTISGKESLQDVTYRIYLGGNASTDFNLIRNNSYTVTVTIQGKNENDVRVTVEKGIPAGSYGDAEWPADEVGA